MRLYGVVLGLALLIASPSWSETLHCNIDSIKGAVQMKWIATSYDFQIDRQNLLVEIGSEGPSSDGIRGTLDGTTAGRRTVMWKVFAKTSEGTPTTLTYRATWLQKADKFILRVSPVQRQGSMDAEGRGNCVLQK
jgi:hypothetical protein